MLDNKIFRITFSYDLASYILKQLDSSYCIKKIKFRVGRRLVAGQYSDSNLYALVSSKNDWVLRIATIFDVAQFLCDWNSRYLAECWIVD